MPNLKMKLRVPSWVPSRDSKGTRPPHPGDKSSQEGIGCQPRSSSQDHVVGAESLQRPQRGVQLSWKGPCSCRPSGEDFAPSLRDWQDETAACRRPRLSLPQSASCLIRILRWGEGLLGGPRALQSISPASALVTREWLRTGASPWDRDSKPGCLPVLGAGMPEGLN